MKYATAATTAPTTAKQMMTTIGSLGGGGMSVIGPPITARAQKYSQILASSSDAVTAANATMNAVIRSWIIVGG